MSDLQWIKLKLSMFDDEKIKLIETMPEGDTVLVVWIKLLILAGKINDEGYIYIKKNMNYNYVGLVAIIGRQENSIRQALQILFNFDMIEYHDDMTLRIKNWDKHQQMNKGEAYKTMNRIRQRRNRYKQKLLQSGMSEIEAENKLQKMDFSDNKEDMSRDMSRYASREVMAQNKNKNKNKEYKESVTSLNCYSNEYLENIHNDVSEADEAGVLSDDNKRNRAKLLLKELVMSDAKINNLARMYNKSENVIKKAMTRFNDKQLAHDNVSRSFKRHYSHFVNWFEKVYLKNN